MELSQRETALRALHTLLQGVGVATVRRNQPEATTVPAGGLIIMQDGDAGEPEVSLSPVSYAFDHRAEIVVQIQHADEVVRDERLDSVLVAIGAAIDADDTLGGAVDYAQAQGPDTLVESVEGAAAIKSARVVVLLEYTSNSVLG